jgi:hypothetical protein
MPSVEQPSAKMCADEAGAAGNKNAFIHSGLRLFVTSQAYRGFCLPSREPA